ncbi:K(+) efflux antiporter 6-like isoform X2 [Olea europaea subsp. europaea]|uniref:K(+) efflux antiporter 6-like isoform X2 n=1 Tax=Olea europaea subsp. europaea TaxID=158383 RepID=A0A8S0RV96_OLEEU|nr:K(+) efflux antiporter 6-like isoform X2 [Olea europaea subsp. europaea]
MCVASFLLLNLNSKFCWIYLVIFFLHQAVLETVARVKPKKNETKTSEEKQVFCSNSENVITDNLTSHLHIQFFFTDYCLLFCYNFRSFKLHHVFKLDNDNGAEETPTLIDRKVKMELRSVHLGPCEWCGGRTSEGVFVGAFLSMSSTAVVYEFLMEKNGTNALNGQVTIGTLILQVSLSSD